MSYHRSAIFCLGFLLFFSNCKKIDSCSRPFKNEAIPQLNRICFGSCASENKSQPILNTVVNKQPDLFVYVGDNIYGDTKDMNVLENKYYKLCSKNEFQNLITHVKTIATWDDHDYGANDSGKNYTKKEASKKRFIEFWGEENNADRNSHDGIYTSYYWGDSAHRVQVILLDCRTFRDDLITNNSGNYMPNYNPNATMLGDAQWTWLKAELQKPAKVRIIASSTQFSRSYDGYEAWANFPLEQQKMTATIQAAQANGVLFISGDVHLAELSKLNNSNSYPIYDFTSSGMTQLEEVDIANNNRIGSVGLDYNIGMIDIDWSNMNDILLVCKIVGLSGNEELNHVIHLNDLAF